MILNMSVTTKFGIIFLLAPFVILTSFFYAFHFLYGITPDLFPDLAPNLISTSVVLLLVWERLRGSLLKDLKWFHKYVLFKLYHKFQPKMDLYYIRKRDFERLRTDLEEYGRSMGLHLYPGKLLEMIDKFLELNEDFSPKLEKIEEWGQKELLSHYSLLTFLHYLGIEPALYSSPSKPVEDAFRDVAQELIQKQPELINGAKDLLQKMRETRKQIYDLLEDFIKDNKLRLEKRSGIPTIT